MLPKSTTSLLPPCNLRLMPLPDRPGYHVSPGGSVWSCRRFGDGTLRRPRREVWLRLKPCRRRDGYLVVSINAIPVAIHRLVLEAFVGLCPPGMECRHLDGCSTNNRPGNLVWGTHAENEEDKCRHGRMAKKLTPADVRAIRASHARGGVRLIDTANQFGLTKSMVSQIVRRKVWKHVAAEATP